MSSRIIDLRSDTVTRPTPEMMQAMARAKVGDDVLGDDPAVKSLEARVAALLGKEAACFVPSGTMANQLAIRTHTQSGDEIICHKDSHIIHYETGAPAALSGAMIQPLDGEFGQFSADAIAPHYRPFSDHCPRSSLLVIENTHNRGGGSVWPVDRIAACCKQARSLGLACHLDGARLWNACIAAGRTPRDYAHHFDSISVCFSKGLGAPVGSALVGNAEFITKARRFRKMFGGSMRQSGLLAAAAEYALKNHYKRLADDHHHAGLLATGLSEIRGIEIAMPVATNMVFIDVSPNLGTAATFCERLHTAGVYALSSGPQRVRMVTHLDVSLKDVKNAVKIISDLCGQGSSARKPATSKPPAPRIKRLAGKP